MADERDFTAGESLGAYGKLAALFDYLLAQYDEALRRDPSFAQSISNLSNVVERQYDESVRQREGPPDGGITSLVGLGDESVDEVSELPPPKLLPTFDESVASERVLALADLYYIYQQERLGVFRVVLKLQELFKRGELRLADGKGAYALYKFDQQKALRSSREERFEAYCRAFGYGCPGATKSQRPNTAFHNLFVNFIGHVATYFRDTRISTLFLERRETSLKEINFGSIATVRRSGLDLRGNLKDASYGQVNVLRIEIMQLLQQAYAILEADDIRREFAAESGWDTLEQIARRYLGEQLNAASRSRLATAGRQILIWLAQPYILSNGRTAFETALLKIGESCEEWMTTAQMLSQGSESNTTRKPAKVIEFKRGRTVGRS